MQALAILILRTILPAACVVGTAYNAALMVNGPDGLRATAVLQAEIEAGRARLGEAETRIALLSDRADGLLMASLDEDLLEESLRTELGLVREGEFMVRMSDVDRLADLAGDDPAITLAALGPR